MLDPWCELLWYTRLEAQWLIMDGMLEGQLPCVQHKSWGGHALAGWVAVDGVAQNGVAEAFFHVDADLVGASCEQATLNESTALIFASLLPFGDGLFSGTVIEHGHALAVHRVASDAVFDAALGFAGNAVDDGEVNLRQSSLTKGLCETAVGDVIFRHDHTAAGVFIEPVNDAGPCLATDTAEVIAVVKERVDERAVGIAGSGVYDEAGWLVEHEDVFVLKEHLQGDVLRHDLHWSHLGDDDADGISGFECGASLRGPAIQRDVAFADEVLNARTRQVPQPSCEMFVETLSTILRFDAPLHGSCSA